MGVEGQDASVRNPAGDGHVAACLPPLSFRRLRDARGGFSSAIFQHFPGSTWLTRPPSAPPSSSLVALLGCGPSLVARAIILIDLSFFLTCPYSSPA